MSTTRIRMLAPTVGFLTLLSVIGINSLETRRANATNSNDTRLKRLLNEKAAILRQDVDHLEKLHKLGEAGFEELFAAHLALHRANLDLCDTDPDRIAVLEKLLNEAKRREDSVMALGGTASSLSIHRAQVDRLDTEIQLERLKSK